MCVGLYYYCSCPWVTITVTGLKPPGGWWKRTCLRSRVPGEPGAGGCRTSVLHFTGDLFPSLGAAWDQSWVLDLSTAPSGSPGDLDLKAQRPGPSRPPSWATRRWPSCGQG